MRKELLLSDEEYEDVETMAACNYRPKDIALYFDIDMSEFMSVWKNKASRLRHHYNRGKLVAEVEISQKRLQNAKNGNLTADQIHNKEKEKRRVEDLKRDILFG